MDSERDFLSQSRRQSTSLTFIPWTAWSCKNYEQGERESFCIKLIFCINFNCEYQFIFLSSDPATNFDNNLRFHHL